MFRKGLSLINNYKCNINYYLSLRNLTNNAKDHKERQLQKQILQTHLGISYQRCAALIRKHDYLQTIDNNRLEATVKSLKRMGIPSEDVFEFPMSLTLHNNTVEHNVKYLQEAGFTQISAQMLLKFRTVVRKPITLLKAHGIIPEDIDVPQRLYSYLFPKPNDFPVLQKFTEDDSIVDIHETVFKHYLVWRFQTTMHTIERICKIYDKFKYKSFDLISQMIQILTEDLKFTNQKVLQNGYLFQSGPDYLRQVLIAHPTLAGVDTKKILYKFPKIIIVPPDNITAIDKYLKDFNIPDKAIRRCYNIYTLAPDTVLYRLNELKKIPEFEVFTNSSRIVKLLLCQNKAKLRLEHLKELKVKCASINLLCSSDLVFEKYTQEGNDKTKGSDLINFICQELDIPEKDCRRQLSNNPHWCHIPLTAIQNTLNYLIDNRLPKSAIAHMPTILLYPKSTVRVALEEIENNPDIELNLNHTERLNLCLYFIERKHHFTGDGIWDNSSLEAASNTN